MRVDEIFRQYDVRGVVGENLTPGVARDLGRAYAAYLRMRNAAAKRVSVGRDVRLSSGDLAQALIEGIVSMGLDVFDLGVCPTPLQYFSLFHLNVDGGVMVTGSHNPPEYNGFKISVGKETIFGESLQEIKRILLEASDEKRMSSAKEKGSIQPYEIIPAYEAHLMRDFENMAVGEQDKDRLKVVVDAGNGTAGVVVPRLLGKLGCNVIELYCEPDGRFPNHHPDPTVVECIQDLARTVLNHEADFGVGYDGDADRIGVVDADGNIVWGDKLMIVLSRDILSRHPGATIIGDVKCSQAMFDDIKKHGGVAIMNRTGHSLVKDRMRAEGALLAGEFSGHIFIADRYFGYDDAIYTTLRLVEIMQRSGKTLQALLHGIPKMVSTPEIRVDCPDRKKEAVVERLRGRIYKLLNKGDQVPHIRDVITVDGMRLVFDDGWGLLRSSNTQPVLVLRFEANTEESLDLYRKFVETELEGILREEEAR